MTDLRTLERDSIRAFVQSAADEGYLSGRVLDYGCGKQPYRDIVEAAGGEYEGYDRVAFGGNVSGEDIGPIAPEFTHWNAVLCTQVIQYVEDPLDFFRNFLYVALIERVAPERLPPGHLVLTYPTTWPEVEPEDLHRFTKAGMERLLHDAGFTIVRHERRAEWSNRGENLAIGYGVIAKA